VAGLLNDDFTFLHDKRMDRITQLDIQRWRKEQLKKNKPASINRKVATLKGLLTRAVEWRVISHNPLAGLKYIKTDSKARVRYLSEQEEKRLRAALAARDVEARQKRASYNQWREDRGLEPEPDFGAYCDHLQPMVILALNTGLRRGELFNLKTSDINLGRKLLTVEGTTAKSGQTRHIPLNDEAYSTIKAWMNDLDSKGLVFPSPVTGGRMDNINTAWQGLIDKAGIKDFRFHDLRHDFASKLVMRGTDLNTVRELLGHSTLKMTLRYSHLAPDHLAKAVARLNQA
jgi:integrase